MHLKSCTLTHRHTHWLAFALFVQIALMFVDDMGTAGRDPYGTQVLSCVYK